MKASKKESKKESKKQQQIKQKQKLIKDNPKDAKQKLSVQAKERAIDLISRQKFLKQWKVNAKGPSLANYEFTIITQTLIRIMNNTNDLATASKEISFVLGANLGYQYWNVILVYGQFSRKTYASGGHYVVFEKFDGLTAIIWHNKLSYQNALLKSIVQQSEYF